MDAPVIPPVLDVLSFQLNVGAEHCELVAFDVLQQQEAKIPFQALNRSQHIYLLSVFIEEDFNKILRFLVYNIGWVDWAIGVGAGEEIE